MTLHRKLNKFKAKTWMAERLGRGLLPGQQCWSSMILLHQVVAMKSRLPADTSKFSGSLDVLKGGPWLV